jgi:NADPH:quinone reductase-like Zn-dependent oxidoreductase
VKAAVYERYGAPEMLQLAELAKPVPKSNEVLIKVLATTVTSADCRVRSLNVPVGFGLISRLVLGLFKPRQPILGSELSGQIEAIGRDVRKFQVGDAVVGFSDFGMGCYAQYRCLPQAGVLTHKPASLSFEEAAGLPFGGTTALHFLRKAKLKPGEQVLINGASGSVGIAAVQLAKHFGCVVTGVCSTVNLGLVKALGADHVIDYTKEDFTKNGRTYDVIMDTVGTAPFSRASASLSQYGRLLLVVADLPSMLHSLWVLMTSRKRVFAGTAIGAVKDLEFLIEMARIGKYKSVIDRQYPLEQVSQAHRYVDTGRKKGSVVITVE